MPEELLNELLSFCSILKDFQGDLYIDDRKIKLLFPNSENLKREILEVLTGVFDKFYAWAKELVG
jgi:hypothetical protein